MTATERTGWRDPWPSSWHCLLGPDFPQCDVDSLWYDQREPVAIIDWKSRVLRWTWDSSVTAQANLANGYSSQRLPNGLPFFVVTYWAGEQPVFRPHALNLPAHCALATAADIEGRYRGCPYATLDVAGFVRLTGIVRALELPRVVAAIARLSAAAA